MKLRNVLGSALLATASLAPGLASADATRFDIDCQFKEELYEEGPDGRIATPVRAESFKVSIASDESTSKSLGLVEGRRFSVGFAARDDSGDAVSVTLRERRGSGAAGAASRLRTRTRFTRLGDGSFWSMVNYGFDSEKEPGKTRWLETECLLTEKVE